jgi:hypothetical protein
MSPGEVEEAGGPVDQDQGKRHRSVDRSVGDAVDDALEERAPSVSG